MIEEIQQLANSTKTQLDLKYKAESIKSLEGFIERNKVYIDKNEWSGLINSCSAFLGQCIIENYGGKWIKDNGEYCVEFDENNKAFPYSKVTKQFENGIEDSIFSFYSAIPKVFNLKKNTKWWRF